jgi:hypothetical protein
VNAFAAIPIKKSTSNTESSFGRSINIYLLFCLLLLYQNRDETPNLFSSKRATAGDME